MCWIPHRSLGFMDLNFTKMKRPLVPISLTEFPVRMIFWSTSQGAFFGHYMLLTWHCSYMISWIVFHTFNWKRSCVWKFLTKIGIMCNGIILYPWPNISANSKEICFIGIFLSFKKNPYITPQKKKFYVWWNDPPMST